MSDGLVYRGTLCAIAGDNLGSHNIGDFIENLSKSTYFCKLCDINCVTLSAGNKFDSKFNNLNFHVCQPGQPPCLGHDLFEGVVSYNLALYIRQFITKQKEFSYVELNNHTNRFCYLGSDANNKRSNVNPGS